MLCFVSNTTIKILKYCEFKVRAGAIARAPPYLVNKHLYQPEFPQPRVNQKQV